MFDIPLPTRPLSLEQWHQFRALEAAESARNGYELIRCGPAPEPMVFVSHEAALEIFAKRKWSKQYQLNGKVQRRARGLFYRSFPQEPDGTFGIPQRWVNAHEGKAV